MKDLLLTAINAKYSHTNLALRYLRNALKDIKVGMLEMSINDSLHQIMTHLLESKADIYGFSSYIWNIEIILKVSELLKKAKPEALIILGGPEVCFEAEKILLAHPFIDCIVTGSGELKISKLMIGLKSNDLVFIEGVYYSSRLRERLKTNFCDNRQIEKPCLNEEDFSSPYTEEELNNLKNRIIYYETIRGCPYHCSYCLSSLEKKLIFKPLSIVFKEIDLFFKIGLKQVKLVDRTFNCRPKRATIIFDYIITKAKKIMKNSEADISKLPNFHFEMTGDQISKEMVICLSKAPKGLIQFEIGVQTTYDQTLREIDRLIDFEKIKNNVKELLKEKNIHIHLDLIAGLPFESYDIFSNSFNQVIALKPDMLQLGFLKGLKGTKIKNEVSKHDYSFSSFPPYEIIRNAYITAKELYLLRDLEKILDRFYNSGIFKITIDNLFFSKKALKPFEFFADFARYWRSKGYFDRGISKDALYEILYQYLNESCLSDQLLIDCLAYDYIYHNQLREPSFYQVKSFPKEAVFEFLKDQQSLYLPEFNHWAAKKVYPQIKILEFCQEFYQLLFPKEFKEEFKQYLLLTKQGNLRLINI